MTNTREITLYSQMIQPGGKGINWVTNRSYKNFFLAMAPFQKKINPNGHYFPN